MSREFEVARDVDLPAAPDDVWMAITADTAAWMFPTGMEIPAGASPPEGAPVTTWDPPHRLVIRIGLATGDVRIGARLALEHDLSRSAHDGPAANFLDARRASRPLPNRDLRAC